MMIVKINGIARDQICFNNLQCEVRTDGVEDVKWFDQQMERLLHDEKMNKRSRILLAATLATFLINGLGSGGSVLAADVGIGQAFEPVKEFLLELGDNLVYVMMIWGAIEGMAGRPASGLKRMKDAGIAYLALNWLPVLIGIIKSARP